MPKDAVDELAHLISEAKRVAEVLAWSRTAKLLTQAALEASREGDPPPSPAAAAEQLFFFPRRPTRKYNREK
jgi:hypothetical protein